ncbi:MAG TPA: ABC transporter substrate-binding protein [Actinomycetota bacterium]|nr:ABC transporter substrate-binding protein [Actinomycetota bacterium]
MALAGACTTPPGRSLPSGFPDESPAPTTSAPTSIRLAVTAPASLDPRDLDTPDSLLVAAQVFDGLVSYDPATQALVPAAAESWQMLDGGRRFVFHLRPGATFHNGEPVRAQSFLTAWNRLADPVNPKPFGFLLEHVEGFRQFQEELTVASLPGVTVINDRTLEVRLSRPWVDFPAVLGHPALSPVPPSAATDLGYPRTAAGNGPYRLAAPLDAGESVLLQRYEEYTGPPGAIPAVEFRSFDDPEQAWPAFLSGELDVAPIPATVLREAQSRFGDQGIRTLGRLLYCGFNQEDPRFRSRALRLAVSTAIDRDELAAEVFGGVAAPATGIVPPTIPGSGAQVCGDRCRVDAEQARGLAGSIPQKERRFALDYASSPVGDRLTAALAAQLGEVGLHVTPRPHEEREFEDLLAQRGQAMFCLVWVADYPRQQALLEPLLASDSPDNHGGTSDARIDALLTEARSRADTAARQSLYTEAERVALTAMHVVPVVWFRSHVAVQPYVQGFTIDPLARYEVATLRVTP